MNVRFFVLFVCATFAVSCDSTSTPASSNNQQAQNQVVDKTTQLDEKQAINIAKAEAVKEQKSIDKYDVKALEETKTWRVEFQLKDLTMGGGLTYVIDKETGKILARQESQ